MLSRKSMIDSSIKSVSEEEYLELIPTIFKFSLGTYKANIVGNHFQPSNLLLN